MEFGVEESAECVDDGESDDVSVYGVCSGRGPRTTGEHLHVEVDHFVIYPGGAMEGVDVLGENLHVIGLNHDLTVVSYQVYEPDSSGHFLTQPKDFFRLGNNLRWRRN